MSLKQITLGLLFIFTLSNQVAAVEKNISVSATVAADATDFTATIEKLTNGSIYAQDSTIEYEITYGSYLATSTNFTLVANWENSSAIEYVTSSATNGYGSTSPVIDLTNKKITWTFSIFPSDTQDQRVRFSFKTLNSNTSASNLPFTISTHIEGPGATTDTKSVTSYYTYTTSRNNSPTATPTPTPTSVSINSVTPTSTPLNNKFTSISIDETSSDSFTLTGQTTADTKMKILYGDKPSLMNSIISDIQFKTLHTFHISDLKSSHAYYFKLIAASAVGAQLSSDTFIVTTASEKSHIDQSDYDVQIHWNRVPLISNSATSFISSTNQPLNLQINVKDASRIMSITAQFISDRVLADSTPPVNEIGLTQLVEILPGVYSAILATPQIPGSYGIEITVRDIYGGTKNIRLSEKIRTGDSLHVRDALTHRAIIGADITIYKKEFKTSRYTNITTALSLPRITDESGNFDVIIPSGEYRFEVSASGYKTQSLNRRIDLERGYPTISLYRETLMGELQQQIQIILASPSKMKASMLTNTFLVSLIIRGQVFLIIALGVNLVFNKLLHGKLGLFSEDSESQISEIFWVGRIIFIELAFGLICLSILYLLSVAIALKHVDGTILAGTICNLNLMGLYSHRFVLHLLKTRFI